MGRVIAFYGADHKCGTSMIAQCFAEYAASEYKDFNILLVHAENGDGELYSPCVHESLESIRPYLAEKLIDSKSIMEKSRYKDNLFIIGGASKPGTSNLYHPDMAQYLLSALAGSFDLIICDSGSEIEHGMSLGAMFGADLLFVVLTQDEYCIRRFEWIKSLLEKINLKPAGAVINRFSPDEVNSKELIAMRMDIAEENVFCIRESKCGKNASQDGKSLMAYKDAKFRKDFVSAAKSILARCLNEQS